MYLDDGVQIGLDDQPFWYGGIFNVYNMGRNLIRPDFDHTDRNVAIMQKFKDSVEELSEHNGGTISTYFHPTEFVTTEFWDAVNFKNGAAPERSAWVRPNKRSSAAVERCFRILEEYVDQAKHTPGVRFVTAEELLQLYRSQTPPQVDPRQVAAHLKEHITFLTTEAGDLSAADALLQLLGLPWRVVDGPTSRGASNYTSPTVPDWLFEKSKEDLVAYIEANHRLPSQVFVGSETLSLPDFTATLANHLLSPGPIKVVKGNVEFEKYVSNDPTGAFRWPIHPKGFSAPELLELARLQAWTLKPARLR
jgi:hypothetical protein